MKKSTWQIKWWERQETHVNTQVFQLSTWQFHSINRQKITAHLHKMHVHHVLKHFNCPSDSKTLSASFQLPYSENCMNDSYEWLLLTVQSKLNKTWPYGLCADSGNNRQVNRTESIELSFNSIMVHLAWLKLVNIYLHNCMWLLTQTKVMFNYPQKHLLSNIQFAIKKVPTAVLPTAMINADQFWNIFHH